MKTCIQVIFQVAAQVIDTFPCTRYYDPKTIGLDFEGMLEDLGNAPDGSVVVLHGSPKLLMILLT